MSKASRRLSRQKRKVRSSNLFSKTGIAISLIASGLVFGGVYYWTVKVRPDWGVAQGVKGSTTATFVALVPFGLVFYFSMWLVRRRGSRRVKEQLRELRDKKDP